MRGAGAILLVAFGTACRALRTDGSGALVSAGPWTPVVQRIVARVEPMILDALGTSWPWQYRVTIDRDYTRHPAYTRDFDRLVGLGPRALANYPLLEFTLAHELVHVHMRGEWRELPPVLQEGVADWIAAVVTCNAGPEWDGELPDPETAREVLTMPYARWLRMESEEAGPYRVAAAYLACPLVRFGTLPALRAVRIFDTPEPGEEVPPWPPGPFRVGLRMQQPSPSDVDEQQPDD